MKKRIITILICLIIIASIGVVLANNKAKINKAAKPSKEKAVVPVNVHEVKEDSFCTTFSVNGTTSPVKEVKIASEVQGKLVSLYIKNGDMVRAGQVIASLDASVLGAQLRSVESSIDKALLDIRRYDNLIQMGGATPMQLENVKLNYNSLQAQKKEVLQQMAHMQIRAPFSGRIENVNVELGSFVSYGTILSDLIDNSSLKIKVSLSEQQAINVRAKQEVSIHTVLLKEPKTGHISMISDKADASGKFTAEILFINSGLDKLKAGMLTDISFNREVAEMGLAVPVSAIVGSTKQAKVFVVNQNKVQQRIVKTGIVTANKVQVIEGLKAGEQVVISGQLNLEDGAVISINK